MKLTRDTLYWIIPLSLATLLLIASVGCSNKDPEPVGVEVTLEQAKAVATDKYNIKEIKSTELKHLEERELDLIQDNAKGESPVYYVIRGIDDNGDNKVVYISSNDKNINFELKE